MECMPGRQMLYQISFIGFTLLLLVSISGCGVLKSTTSYKYSDPNSSIVQQPSPELPVVNLPDTPAVSATLTEQKVASGSPIISLTLSNLKPGNLIRLYLNSPCQNKAFYVGYATGTTQTVSTPFLTPGVNYIYAKQDDDQTFSTCSEPFRYVYDTTPLNLNFNKVVESVTEGYGQNNFEVTIAEPELYDIIVHYDLMGSTAGSALHTLVAGFVTIPAGQRSARIDYSILNDGVTSANSKYIQVNLTGFTNGTGTVGINSQIKTYIMDSSEAAPTTVVRVAVANTYTCTIDNSNDPTSGRLWCWGDNRWGQLGNGTILPSTQRVHVDPGTFYKEISTDQNHSCGVTVAGVLKCWGDDTWGRLGNGPNPSSLIPEVIDSGVTYQTISAYGATTCGITTDNRLKCWGHNSWGQIGNGTTTHQYSPLEIDSGVGYSKLSTGGSTVCGITTTGVLKCWGSNSYYAIGDGTATDRWFPTIVDTGTSYSDVLLIGTTTYGLTTAGVIKTWGQTHCDNIDCYYNTTPQIYVVGTYSRIFSGGTMGLFYMNSSGDIFNNTTFIPLKLKEFSREYAGHFCAITIEDRLLCRGYGQFGQLGNGKTSQFFTPSTSSSLSNLRQISGNNDSLCGLDSVGKLFCWGYNFYGQLGSGDLLPQPVPKAIDPSTTYSFIAVGNRTCGLTSLGKLKCWGQNVYGQVGDGTTTNITLPTEIDAATNYTAIKFGIEHTCGLTTLGKIKCWGKNNWGQLGDGTTAAKTLPVEIDGLTTYSHVSVGDHHSCGLTTAGEIKCWGYNFHGQVGDNSTVNKPLPTVIDGATTYKKVFAFEYNTCGVTMTNDLKCWGHNYRGQVGNNSTTNQLTPIVVDLGVDYVNLSNRNARTCGITTSEKIRCWGKNDVGQIGNGTSTDALTPTLIDGTENYSKLSLGANYSCAITSSGVLKCWGEGAEGKIGHNSLLNSLVPVTIDSGVSYNDVVTSSVSFGMTTAGTVKVWGTESGYDFAQGDSSEPTLNMYPIGF